MTITILDGNIKDLIYTIRGQQVILDSDLAELYGYEVKQFNRQVKNNIERFPVDFMFQLTANEMIELSRCKKCTSIQTKGVKGGRSYKAYVFTEQGVNMLSSVLKGELAVFQSIAIMRAFKEMRNYINQNQTLINSSDFIRLSMQVEKNNESIDQIEKTMATKEEIEKILNCFEHEEPLKQAILFENTMFSADELIFKIFKKAEHTIEIVDDYVNIDTLSLCKFKKENISLTLYTDNKGHGANKLRQKEVDDFNLEHGKLIVKENGSCHDRLIGIDIGTSNEEIYIIGASLKDLGKKLCGINQIVDTSTLHTKFNELRNGKTCLK